MSIADRDIMSVAEDLFAERGYASVSTREIASRAGITEMTLFRKFHTKRELFNRILAESWPEAAGCPDPCPAFSGKDKTELRAFIKTVFDECGGKRKIARAIAISPEVMDESVRDFIQKSLATTHRRMQEVLTRISENPVADPDSLAATTRGPSTDSELVASHLIAQMMGFFLLEEVFKVPSNMNWERLEQDFMDRLVDFIGLVFLPDSGGCVQTGEVLDDVRVQEPRLSIDARRME